MIFKLRTEVQLLNSHLALTNPACEKIERREMGCISKGSSEYRNCN